MSRSPLLLGPLVAGALLLTACGGGATAPPRPPVRLDVSRPGDDATVRGSAVELGGHVRPAGARVRVRGARVPVRDGAFSTRVALEPGVNVVDVIVTDGAARPAVTAIRVRREVVVSVPDLAGEDPDGAAAKLRALDLTVRRQNGGGLFDALVPSDPVVCATDPAAQDKVPVGTTVTLTTARLC